MDNISVVRFRAKHHLPLLHEMLESQRYMDVSGVTAGTLPKVGYVALLGDTPVAAGFLRRLEPCYGQLDGLTSNARLDSTARHQGVSLVVDALLADAKKLNIKGILAISKDTGVLTRAQGLGFRVIEQSLIGLALENS